MLTWLSEEELATLDTSAYWNDAAGDTGAEFDAREGGGDRFFDYVKSRTNLWRQFDALTAFAGRLGRPPRGAGLDVAAGACWTTALLSKLPEVDKVIAVDMSRHRLTKLAPALFELLKADESKITQALGSFYTIRLADGSLDFCFLSQAFHHADDPSRLLAELRRVLKPGGAVLVMGETPVRPLDVFMKRLKNAAKLFAPRSSYAEPRVPGWFPSFEALFPPDPVLGDHYYMEAHTRRLFQDGVSLRGLRLGTGAVYVALKKGEGEK